MDVTDYRQRTLESFANRFEPDGEDYIFRRTLRSPGVRVTAPERDRFVADFNRRFQRLTGGPLQWLIVAGIVGIAVALIVAGVPVVWLMAGEVSVVLIAITLFTTWAWAAPTRAFRNRTLAAPAYSAVQARQIAFSRFSWKQMGVALIVGLFAFARLAVGHDLLVGWGRLWLVLIGAYILLFAVQAVRKLRAR